MTSRPWFTRPAESIVTFGPMAQLGWARAWSSVAEAMRSADQSRKGPPEAVSVIRSIVDQSASPSAWKMALCSLSSGKSVAPCRFAAAITAAPAQTSVSLLASAMTRPASMAEKVGRMPAVPAMAPITRSHGRRAASSTASGPAAQAMPVPARAAFSAA